MERKLVTVRTVDELIPIEGADRIELAKFGGWQCVVKKGEFSQGDKAVYFEIDSLLPLNDERFKFLEKQDTKKSEYRLRTVKLRGQISQGLALPLTMFPEITDENADLDSLLKITKFEPVITNQAEIKGVFPEQLFPKTDAERVQNYSWEELQELLDEPCEVSVKMDGTSLSVANFNDEVIICQRNYQVKNECVSLYTEQPTKLGLTHLDEWQEKGVKNIALQGELIGNRIQNNPENLKSHQWLIFSIYDIDKQQYLEPMERSAIVDRMCLLEVPVLSRKTTMREFVGEENSKDEKSFRAKLQELSNGKSLFAKEREGIVFKFYNKTKQDKILKVISNKYLLKNNS